MGRGTGLGLTTAYGIIKLHKGYIDVWSELGKGTTFKLYLPVIDAAPAKENASESSSYLTEGTETILLAEDDVTLRSLSESVLREHGYKVIAAENGEEAINRFIENKDEIHLLLLDMIMPEKNGKEAYDEIKRIRPDIKVLFVSGHADLEQNGGVLSDGLDFMSKPISPILLLKKVRTILDR
jgi:CheY-like chemotaxis protein